MAVVPHEEGWQEEQAQRAPDAAIPPVQMSVHVEDGGGGTTEAASPITEAGGQEARLLRVKQDLIKFNRPMHNSEERSRMIEQRRAWVAAHLPEEIAIDEDLHISVSEILCRDPNCPIPMEVALVVFWGGCKSWKGSIPKHLRDTVEADFAETVSHLSADAANNSRKQKRQRDAPSCLECCIIPLFMACVCQCGLSRSHSPTTFNEN